MSLSRRSYPYSKVENEDPDEKAHRQAQFLIDKALKQLDLQSRKRPWTSVLRVKSCKLKVRIGKRLRTLRKSIFLDSTAAARISLYKKIMAQLKFLNRLFRGGEAAVVTLPPPMFD